MPRDNANKLFDDLINEIAKKRETSLTTIENEMKVETDYCFNSIRNFRTRSGSHPQQNSAKRFAKGIAVVARNSGLEERYILTRITEYYKVCGLYDRCSDSLKFIVKEVYTERKKKNLLEGRNIESLVVVDTLKNKIVNFLQNDEIDFLYLFGVPGTGLTTSLYKIISELKERVQRVSYCTFFNKNQLQDALSRIPADTDVIVYELGDQEINNIETLRFEGKKMIIISYLQDDKMFEVRRSQRIFFNDCLSKKTVEEVIAINNYAFYDEVCKHDLAKEKLIDRVLYITGGVPVAVRMIADYIQENYKYKGLQTILDELENYNLVSVGKLYSRLYNKILHFSIMSVKPECIRAISKAMYFDGDISLRLLMHILSLDNNSDEWHEILNESMGHLIVLQSGKRYIEKSDEKEIYDRIAPFHKGIRMIPIVKHIMRGRFWNEDDHYHVMRAAAEYYEKESAQVAENWKHSGDVSIFDRSGEIDVLLEVLKYCEQNSDCQKYFDITRNLNYYLYLHNGLWDKLEELYRNRIRLAHKEKQHAEVITTYGHLLNLQVRRHRTDSIRTTLDNAEHYMEEFKLKSSDYTTFQHAKGLKLLLIDRDYDEAYAIFEKLVQDTRLTSRERFSERLWLRKSKYFKKGVDLMKLAMEFEDGFNSAQEQDYLRAQIDYLLFLTKIYLRMHLEDCNKNLEVQNDENLQIAGEYLEYVKDILGTDLNDLRMYKGEYHLTMAVYKNCMGMDYSDEIKTAKSIYSKQGRKAYALSIGRLNNINESLMLC